jgi:hypothetical protein
MRGTIFRQSQLFEVCVGINKCFRDRLLGNLNNSITHGPPPNVYWCDTVNDTTGFLQNYSVGSSPSRHKLRHEIVLESR